MTSGDIAEGAILEILLVGVRDGGLGCKVASRVTPRRLIVGIAECRCGDSYSGSLLGLHSTYISISWKKNPSLTVREIRLAVGIIEERKVH